MIRELNNLCKKLFNSSFTLRFIDFGLLFVGSVHSLTDRYVSAETQRLFVGIWVTRIAIVSNGYNRWLHISIASNISWEQYFCFSLALNMISKIVFFDCIAK